MASSPALPGSPYRDTSQNQSCFYEQNDHQRRRRLAVANCSKTVVVLCSNRGRLDHDGSTGGVCKRLENPCRVENFHNGSEPSCELKIRRYVVPGGFNSASRRHGFDTEDFWPIQGLYGVATTSMSPRWSAISTRTASFLRSKKRSTDALPLRRPLIQSWGMPFGK